MRKASERGSSGTADAVQRAFRTSTTAREREPGPTAEARTVRCDPAAEGAKGYRAQCPRLHRDCDERLLSFQARSGSSYPVHRRGRAPGSVCRWRHRAFDAEKEGRSIRERRNHVILCNGPPEIVARYQRRTQGLVCGRHDDPEVRERKGSLWVWTFPRKGQVRTVPSLFYGPPSPCGKMAGRGMMSADQCFGMENHDGVFDWPSGARGGRGCLRGRICMRASTRSHARRRFAARRC